MQFLTRLRCVGATLAIWLFSVSLVQTTDTVLLCNSLLILPCPWAWAGPHLNTLHLLPTTAKLSTRLEPRLKSKLALTQSELSSLNLLTGKQVTLWAKVWLISLVQSLTSLELRLSLTKLTLDAGQQEMGFGPTEVVLLITQHLESACRRLVTLVIALKDPVSALEAPNSTLPCSHKSRKRLMVETLLNSSQE